MSEAPKFGLVHTEWYTDDDCDRVEGSREAMQASADRLNAEWPAERWHVAPAVDSAPVAAPDLQAAYVAEVSRHRETMHERDRMRLMLGALKAWCSRNGHTYAEELAMHGLGESLDPPSEAPKPCSAKTYDDQGRCNDPCCPGIHS